MKVKQWVSLEQEIEVDVSVEEFLAALEDIAEARGSVGLIVGRVCGVLRDLSDEQIGTLSEGARKTVREFLENVIDRF